MSLGTERLGSAVKQRRTALGLSLPQVYQRGGPSDTRVSAIENNSGPVPKASTLYKLDAALRWEPGSAQSVLDGGDPVPLEGPSININVEESLQLQDSVVVVSNAELARMLISLQKLSAAVEQSELAQDPCFDAAYKEHARVVSAIIGKWVTTVLEANVTEGRTLPVMLELALGHYLNQQPSGNAEDIDDQNYRRYLAGRPINVPTDKLEQFERRFRQARYLHTHQARRKATTNEEKK